MAKLFTSRTAQYLLVAEFAWEIGDTMVNTSGVEDNFATATAHVFDVINLPPGAIVMGGEVVTETAVSGATGYTVSIGDSLDTTRYLSAAARHTAGRTAITPTGYVSDGKSIRMTVTPSGGTATAGKFSVRIQYVVRNRANEAQTN